MKTTKLDAKTIAILRRNADFLCIGDAKTVFKTRVSNFKPGEKVLLAIVRLGK